METLTSTAARRDPEVRAKLKEQQQARLAMKARVASGEIEAEEYSAMYASQPEQLIKQKRNDKIAAARRAERRAANAAAIENAEGGASAFAGDAQ